MTFIYLLTISVLIFISVTIAIRLHLNQIKLTSLSSQFEKLSESERHLRATSTEQESKLQHVFEDPVTQLPGWVVFEDRLTHSIRECERYQLNLGILLIDIDDFKVINDALSYEVGDVLLKEVAERIKSCTRQVDCVSRFTKDTFVVLLTQLSKPEMAALVAQRMLQALAEPFQILGNELYVTAGIGIALCPSDGNDATSLLRSADHALHLAKEKGKNSYQFYQERLHVKSQRELALYNSLNRDYIYREFIIYFQPVKNVINRNIICMDAMLHWQHAELGLITPEELFAIVERQRKLNVITEWLLENACRQYQQWHELGFKPEMVGVPISIKQLEHSQFIYRISQILQELKMNPQNVLLLLTDGAPQLSYDVLDKAFNMLKYIGVKLAIDDFGETNSFTLRYLKSFNIDYIKINNLFVDDIVANQQTQKLVKSIEYLAQNFSIQVIAQGVRSNEQLEGLKSLGCFLMQGECIGAPLSENDVKSKMVVTIS